MFSKRMTRSSWIPVLASASVMFHASAASAAETARVYDANCAMCHQKAGVGLVGQFPRLAGRVAEMANTEEGRRYLIEVTLFGMAGQIEVDGAPIIGVMPPFSMLSDEDVAGTLNYLISLEAKDKKRSKGKSSISSEDVAKVRSGPVLSPGQVHSNRTAIVTKVNAKT